MTNWPSTFKNDPAAGDKINEGDDNIRETRGAIEERISNEHTIYSTTGTDDEWSNTAGAATKDWVHKDGSASAWCQSAEPTDTNRLYHGKLWVDTDDGTLYIYDHNENLPDRPLAGASSDKWKALTPALGQVSWFPDTPNGRWLRCDGSTIDKSTNPEYTALVDMLQAEASGNFDGGGTTATVPDIETDQRFIRDAGAAGDSGDTGDDHIGAHTHDLDLNTENESAHTHDIPTYTGTFSGTDDMIRASSGDTLTGVSDTTDAGTAHLHAIDGATEEYSTGDDGDAETYPNYITLYAYIGY